MGSLIRATNLWGYSALVRQLGGEPEALLTQFGVPADIEQHDDTFVDFETVALLLDASVTAWECPDFGLQLARWQGLDILGPIAVIARNSPTVAAGLDAVARYLYVHSPALELAAAPPLRAGTMRFTYRINELSLPRLAQAYELSMANGARIIRLLAGDDAEPVGVSFLHQQRGPWSTYAEVLGSNVRFEQDWCGFEVSTAVADRTIDAADPATREIAAKYLEAVYRTGEGTLADRVADLVRRLLPTGQCTVEVIADQLALHPRTLQRRLEADGLRCNELIDRERRELAARYLADPRFGLAQVAGLLGYHEQSSLNRACRRWFARTPRQYRAAQQP